MKSNVQKSAALHGKSWQYFRNRLLSVMTVLGLLISGTAEGQTSVHLPGIYEKATTDGGYGVSLTTSSQRDYEIYTVQGTGIYAGGTYQVASISSLAFSGEWLAGNFRNVTTTSITISSSQFDGMALVECGVRYANTITLKVRGYDQFSIIAKDNSTTTQGKSVSVVIDNVAQTMSQSNIWNIRSFILDPLKESTIVFYGGMSSFTDSNNYFSAFSLRLPECTAPTITLGTNPTIKQGTTTATLPYTAVTNTPTTYSIDWNAAANTAGLTDVTNAALPESPISITVPAGIAVATYTGSLTVKNAEGCTSTAHTITLTVNECVKPSITKQP